MKKNVEKHLTASDTVTLTTLMRLLVLVSSETNKLALYHVNLCLYDEEGMERTMSVTFGARDSKGHYWYGGTTIVLSKMTGQWRVVQGGQRPMKFAVAPEGYLADEEVFFICDKYGEITYPHGRPFDQLKTRTQLP